MLNATTRLQTRPVQVNILMHGEGTASPTTGRHQRQLVGLQVCERPLLITGTEAGLFRQHPDLQKFQFLSCRCIEFAVANPSNARMKKNVGCATPDSGLGRVAVTVVLLA